MDPRVYCLTHIYLTEFSMSRYHFNVYDGETFIDTIGTELPDEWTARQEAIRTAGRILDDERHRLALGQDWTMEVTDARGLILFRLDFHVTGSPVIHGQQDRSGGT